MPDWSGTDWSKSDDEIALEKGVSPLAIYRPRKRYAPETLRTPFDFSQIDWNKPNSQIAMETGLATVTISQRRREMAPETIDYSNEHRDIDWSSVDWEERTTDIANDLGVGKSVVSHFRALLAPWSLMYRAPKWRWETVDWTKSNYEIAQDLISKLDDPEEANSEYALRSLQHVISHRRKRDAPETMGMLHGVQNDHTDWSQADWSKSDQQLATENDVLLKDVKNARRSWGWSFQDTSSTQTAP